MFVTDSHQFFVLNEADNIDDLMIDVKVQKLESLFPNDFIVINKANKKYAQGKSRFSYGERIQFTEEIFSIMESYIA